MKTRPGWHFLYKKLFAGIFVAKDFPDRAIVGQWMDLNQDTFFPFNKQTIQKGNSTTTQQRSH